jgi:chromodomain-containing protein
MAELRDRKRPPSAYTRTIQDLSPPAVLVVPEDNQYTVERLLRRRVRRINGHRRKVTQYLVKWEGYPNEHINVADIHEDIIKAYAAVTGSA